MRNWRNTRVWERMCGGKTTAVPLVIGALGAMTPKLEEQEQHLKSLPRRTAKILLRDYSWSPKISFDV